MSIDQLVQDEIMLRKARIKTMREYLLMKLDENDYHGVQDAASDLRDIESEIIGLSCVGLYVGVPQCS